VNIACAREIVMRVVVVAVGAMVLLAMPANAQGVSSPNAPPGRSLPSSKEPIPAEEHPAVKADDKAYKSALDGIQPKQSYDPWGNVREKPKARNSR